MGYQSLVSYTIVSFFGVQISNIDVNETLDNWADDYTGNSWMIPQAGSLTITSSFADSICAASQTTPPSLPPQSPLSTVAIDHASQAWFVGGVDSGEGVEVQTDTFQRYQDHGRHNSIVSPVR